MHIESVVLEADDPAAAEAFYRDALGLGPQVRVRAAGEPAGGFRGFTLSLVVAQPNGVELLIASALDAGATAVKPIAKGLWGVGGVVQAPDGAIWKVATSKRRDSGPATREIDDIVLLLGASDVKASKRFYADRGLPVKRSFGGRYAEFDAPAANVKLALLGRQALAKDAGVAADGTGSPRMAIVGSGGPFVDRDGFAWEAAAPTPTQTGSQATISVG